MAQAEARWSVSLEVTCPHCDEEFDLTDDTDFWVDSNFEIAEHDTPPNPTGVDVTCPHCGADFDVDFVY